MRFAGAATLLSSVLLMGGWGFAPPSPHAVGPPSGHTGGFGEPTCQECHTEYGLNEPGGSLTVEGLPRAWEPERSYVLVVVLRTEEMGLAGFQLAVRSARGDPAGILSSLGPRVAVVDSAGIPYAQHTLGGTDPDTPDLARWTVEWQAPATGGAVHVHAAANSANGDNSPFGDLIYTTAATVPRAPPPP